jgi:polysaccharide biosynthesis protein PelF
VTFSSSTTPAPVGLADARRPRVLLTTEGTYPFAFGGVSTWCDIVVNGIPGADFDVFAITAGGIRRPQVFELPANARLVGHVDLWSERVTTRRPGRRANLRTSLAAELARGLLLWDGDPTTVTPGLVWCREHPTLVRAALRHRDTWANFRMALGEVLAADTRDPGRIPPVLDEQHVCDLYQTLCWIAQAAAAPTPSGANAPDIVIVTAAGWAAIPAVVHRALYGTPMVLSEHGVYVREAYLAAIRSSESSGERWAHTRVARGLARLTYAACDVVAPVTGANAAWEAELGADPARIRTIHNGVLVPSRVGPFPSRPVVITIGRVDPLKDLKTLLRAAANVVEQVPGARFVHYGPTPEGNERYEAECRALWLDLGLGDSFEFSGETDDPYAVLAQASISVLSSISEGFPISVLEAMAAGRPVVATAVGGVPEALSGCGFTVRPGDYQALAEGIVTLLRDPALGASLGAHGRHRVIHHFGQEACLNAYADLIGELTGCRPEVAMFDDDDDTPAVGLTLDDTGASAPSENRAER